MKQYFEELLRLTNKAFKKDEIPVAAIIVNNGKIIAKAYNKRNKSNKTIDHAEIIAITKANRKLHSWRLNNCSLYVTLEPCDMCKTVIKESRIENVYYIVDRFESKLQYNRVNFQKMDISKIETAKLKKYYKIINIFWKNKRKK